MKKTQKWKYPNLKFILMIVFLLGSSISIIAQGSGISGKVTDEAGELLQGVIVMVKGTKTGTVTDANGNFTLKGVSDNNVTLTFSYLGFSQKEIKTEGNKNIQVILLEDTQSLDEVVVVGYGEVKRQDLTGAVGTVRTTDLQ
ncbi:MAG: carboxypeptidase-like regulatory domain-containing protein [Dysgonomonas sp.]